MGHRWLPLLPLLLGAKRPSQAPVAPVYASEEDRVAAEMDRFASIDRESIALLDALLFGEASQAAGLATRVDVHIADFVGTYMRVGEAAQRGGRVTVEQHSTVIGPNRYSPWDYLWLDVNDACGEVEEEQAYAVVERGYFAARVVCGLFKAAIHVRAGQFEMAGLELDAVRRLAAEQQLQAEIVWKIDYVAGWLAFERKDERAAFAAWYEAVRGIEVYRAYAPLAHLRQRYLEERTDLYAIAVEVGRRVGDPRWFELAELQRARLFLESMRGAGSTAAREARVASLADLQAGLGPEEAFVWYEPFGGQLRAVVIAQDGFEVVPLPLREAALRSLVDRVYRTAADPAESFDVGAAAELHRALLAPVRASAVARARTRYLVVPFDPIARLPLEVLVEVEGDRPRFVAESLTISYVPSATITLAIRARDAAAPASLLALGDPEFRGPPGAAVAAVSRGLDVVAETGTFPPLPGTRTEVQLAERAFEDRGLPAATLLGPEATETSLRRALAARPSHLVLATHGVYEPTASDSEPLLVLALPDTQEDGLLRASEVGSLAPVDVVVLSACKSGLGERVPIEGVLGFPRAFLAGGARHVIVSLWPIPDAATATQMGALYPRLAAGEDPGAALAAVRRAWLAGADAAKAHPSQWAGLVHYGAGR